MKPIYSSLRLSATHTDKAYSLTSSKGKLSCKAGKNMKRHLSMDEKPPLTTRNSTKDPPCEAHDNNCSQKHDQAVTKCYS